MQDASMQDEPHLAPGRKLQLRRRSSLFAYVPRSTSREGERSFVAIDKGNAVTYLFLAVAPGERCSSSAT